MNSRVTGRSRLAAAGAVIIVAAGVAGCASSGSTTPRSTASASQAAQTPLQAIEMAASASRNVNSLVADMSIKTSGNAGALDLSGTITEQLHPSLVARADFSLFSINQQSLPSGMSEIITSTTMYLRMSLLSQALHTNKQWIEIPYSALNKGSGVYISSLFSQFQTSSPPDQSQLFTGARNVRKVGTGVVNGVPVTEYSGTVSIARALSKLPASVRTSFGQAIQKAGIISVKFTEWVDGQHQVRKILVIETGSNGLSETITTTIVSINQPVSIQLPPASQIATTPASIPSTT